MKPESKTKSIKKADSEKKKSTGKIVQPKQEGAGKTSKTKITSGKPVPVAEKAGNGKTGSGTKGSGKAVAEKPATGNAKTLKVTTGKNHDCKTYRKGEGRKTDRESLQKPWQEGKSTRGCTGIEISGTRNADCFMQVVSGC